MWDFGARRSIGGRSGLTRRPSEKLTNGADHESNADSDAARSLPSRRRRSVVNRAQRRIAAPTGIAGQSDIAPPIPSYPVFAPPPAAGPGPSTWQSWRGPERGRSRHSMDARSQGSDDMMSPRMEALDEIGEVVFHPRYEQPRSSQYDGLYSCRRQK